MNLDFQEFVHPRHIDAFLKAANQYNCHILVRKTGRPSLQYLGRPGYSGKRANMKAKTAKFDSAGYQLAGLVCSPELHPGAFGDIGKAMSFWLESRPLIRAAEFGDNDQPRGCDSPYLLQTNRRHRHYGCVAWVEHGLLTPRYVHGDYDLYAILPAGRGFDLGGLPVKHVPMNAVMDPPRALSLQQRLQREAELKSKFPADRVGPLTFEVANFLNLHIAKTEPGLLGALMVNHGEHVNQGADKQDFQEVLAFMPRPRGGEHAVILGNRQEHEAFYRNA